MFDEYVNPPSSVLSCGLPVVALQVVDASENSLSTSIDQAALATKPSSQESSSKLQSTSCQPLKHINKWTKIHPLNNVIGNPSRPVSTCKMLQTDAMWCYFDAFLAYVEPKNYKKALLVSLWIESMQDEIHEFESLEV
uniref:Integrase, catalytic region, zinc finger, CCHC-type, peptidase aspartic, catalytic n=1 Tax=Tanacetum cinerariifolium TaxID=118510 RepID=A0A6L2NIQ3_TANCI|nr:integrase, catalytic region, zinc finger, CCHC-type, peptidase aspartic, catalytic [Tanacetum cinerariifolium]